MACGRPRGIICKYKLIFQNEFFVCLDLDFTRDGDSQLNHTESNDQNFLILDPRVK